MYKFIKIKNEKNQYDITDVIIQTKNNDASLNDLFEVFKSFLLGCGYIIKQTEEVQLVDIEQDNEKEIPIDLTDKQFNDFAKMAYEKDITINQVITNVLKDELKNMKIEKEANEIFNDVINKLQKNNNQKSIDDINLEFMEAAIENEDEFDTISFNEPCEAYKAYKKREIPDSVETEAIERCEIDQPDSVEVDSVNKTSNNISS